MKKIILNCINFYQVFISVTLKNLLGTKAFCRYSPSCSEYTKQAIRKYGILKGGKLGLLRILSCQPFAK